MSAAAAVALLWDSCHLRSMRVCGGFSTEIGEIAIFSAFRAEVSSFWQGGSHLSCAPLEFLLLFLRRKHGVTCEKEGMRNNFFPLFTTYHQEAAVSPFPHKYPRP